MSSTEAPNRRDFARCMLKNFDNPTALQIQNFNSATRKSGNGMKYGRCIPEPSGTAEARRGDRTVQGE